MNTKIATKTQMNKYKIEKPKRTSEQFFFLQKNKQKQEWTNKKRWKKKNENNQMIETNKKIKITENEPTKNKQKQNKQK